MKRRTWLFVLGSLLLAVALALVAVRLPVTQGWMLRRAVAGVPGLELKVSRVSAGLSGAELRGIEASYEGTSLRLPLVRASYDGWALLTRRELIVDELSATDAEIALAATAAAESPAPQAAAEAFAGFLAPLQLPVKATVGSVQIGGRVQITATQTMRFSAQGSLLLPGKQASTDIHVEYADSAEGAAAAKLDWVGRLTLAAAADGKIQSVGIDGTLAMPNAKPGAPEHGLVTKLAIAHAADGAETLEATVNLSTAKATDEPVTRMSLVHRAGAADVAGEWSLKLRQAQLEGVADLSQLPEFTTDAHGTFKFAVASGDFAADGQATVGMSKLQRLRREFAGLGLLTGKADFAIESKGGELRLSKLDAALNDARGPVLRIEALQPVSYRLDTQAVSYAQPDKDLLRLEVSNLPLAWAQPWLGDATLGGTVSSGEIRLKGAGSAWAVGTTRPFAFAGVRVASGKQVLAEQLGGELALRASVDGAAWSVDSLDLGLSSTSDAALSAVGLKLEARQDAQGRGMIALPLTLDNGGRRSQLRLDGEWTLSAGVRKVTARISGDTVYLRDVAGLASLMPKSEQPAPAAATGAGKLKAKTSAASRNTAKDATAFWAGVDGRVDVDLKRLVLESEEVTGVRAAFVCDATKLQLEKLTATTKRAALEAAFGATFDAARSAPYALTGSFKFPGFDLGAWLRAASPEEEPAMETVLDIDAKVEGQGNNLDDLLAGVRGDFVLKGGAGVLRIKDKRVEAASQLGGLVLGLLSKEKQQKPAVAAGAQLVEEMREFRFERIDISLLRGEDMNLLFRAIDVRSAEKRLSGSGKAKHVAGRTIDEYPLELEVRLAGKGNFGSLLEKAGLLDGSKDDLGYFPVRQAFVVSGTVGEPNWKKMLVTLGAGLVFGK